MLQSSSLAFAYAEQSTLKFPDLNIKTAEQWLILGNSGCGKTTFLNLLTGLLKPKSGRIVVENQDLTQLSISDLDRFRGTHFGIVTQQSHFVKSLNVVENLRLTQYLTQTPSDYQRINDLLKQLDLAHKKNTKTQNLSIGEQQRLSIVRALLLRPKIVFADEPTSALDDFHCQQVVELLEKQSRQEGCALVIVTHDKRLKHRFLNQVELS